MSFIVQSLAPRLKRWQLTRKIMLATEDLHGGRANHRVCNNGFWTMKNSIAYITLNVQESDVLKPPQGEDAFIKPNNFSFIHDQQLCWSVHYPIANPMKVDIYAGENQPISLYEIRPDMIMLPSEKGWEPLKDKDGHNLPRMARVFIKRKKYDGTLKIVSEDTTARSFKIIINL